MSRWVCVCAYDGGPFSGWQSQAKKDALQDILEARLQAIFKAPVRIHGSGRTDAGVHAEGQVFHFDADWSHGKEKLKSALSSVLPREIQIRSVRPVSKDFHARFSATGKRYVYHLYLGDPDPFRRRYVWALPRGVDRAKMVAAARRLVGTHDFKAFTAENGEVKETTVRTLRRLDIGGRGKALTVTAEADGFLYKMVRSLVGALVAVGEGRLSADDLTQALETRIRPRLTYSAPAQGLRLVKVLYARGPK